MTSEPPGRSDGSIRIESLLLVGAGKMGGALLQGWLALGLDGRKVTILDPVPSPDILALAAIHGLSVNPPPGSLGTADVMVLAVKPQMLDAVLPAIAPRVGPETLVLSIVAGKTIRDLSARLPNAGFIVRAMPNTPAAVGRGITGVVVNPALSPGRREVIGHLLSAAGQVEWLAHEGLIDAVTAVSGSGPAYVFYLTECLARAGEAAGLDADMAARLARATVEGAAELMHRSPDVAPTVLRQNVTSPAGTTAAGLAVLGADAGLEALMVRTVAAAKRRAEELGG